jgi:hypothetical protein
MIFTEPERELLASLADVLIPAGMGFPAASEAGVARAGLDQAISFRPDLGPALKSILAFARGRNVQEAIAELPQSAPALWAALTEFVPGAYFLNEQVRIRLKYAGQSGRPIDPRPDYLDDNLLQAVIDRGAIYRPTPKGELS